ncbi:MAG: MlaD family protein [Pseudomonadota bacterium]
MTDQIPDLSPTRARRGFFSGASFVWLVPIAALATALAVALTTYAERGPVIRIGFSDAAGILPDETELRFRNVAVGIVEEVGFNDDLSQVLVDVRLDRKVAPFVDDSAEFWVVRPEVTVSGVSGLDTVLSGVYIEGTWDNVAGGVADTFEGRENAPLATVFRPGTRIELRSTRASGLAANTPILFKGIEVGRIGASEISRDGRWVSAEAIIYAPHGGLVSTATRFWDASGFSFSLGPNGAELDFSSVATLIAGGITFDTLVSGGTPLRPGMVFEVFPDQAAARSSVFESNEGAAVTFTMIFEENASGLAANGPVEWRGVRIGQVVNVTGIVDQETFGDARVRLMATVEITPSRFGLGDDLSEEEILDYFEARAAEGLRARLANGSILTGGLKIELVSEEDAEPAAIDRDADPFPVFPATESELADVSATAEGLFQRVNALPVEELLASAIAFLDNATALVASEDLRQTPGEIRGLLAEARGVIGSEELQALPADVRVILLDLQSASGDLSALLTQLREAGAAERLLTAIDQVGTAAEAANTALAGVPALTQRVTEFVERANSLPLDQLVAEASSLAADTRVFVASEAFRALPASITSAAAELETLLSSVTETGTAATLNTTIREAGEAAMAIEAAAAGVPNVVARIDRIAARAEDVRLDTLAKELEDVLDTAARLFGDASEADLPDALAGALGEAEAALAELRSGGLVESANVTLASARDAAVAIEAAAGGLPDLVARMEATLGQARTTLAGFDDGSAFQRETSAALREIERAAEAVTDLARAIERRPNSLILGR